MSKPKTIVVDGITYYSQPQLSIESPIKICVLQRGWVMIGRFEREGNICKLRNAYNIRRWGTDSGLGQLARDGKQEETQLDKCNGIVEFDYLTMCFSIDCVEESWKEL